MTDIPEYANDRDAEWVVIGRVARPHGLRGELRLIGVDDGMERFSRVSRVLIEPPGGSPVVGRVESYRSTGRVVLLKVSGIEDRDAAETFRNATVSIRREEAPPLDADEYYAYELVGAEVVTTDGRSVGRVVAVQEFPANDALVVKSDAREILIPAVQAVVRKVDVQNRLITIEAVEGLVD